MIKDVANYHQSLTTLIHEHLPKNHLRHKYMSGFLESLNELCFTFEQEKEKIKSLIRPNERRYVEINKKLKREIEQRRESINKLSEGISKLDLPQNYQLPNFDNENLFELATFIKKLLIYQKGIEIQLRKAKADAERASNAKTDFLSMMSHEIRTPLNGIVAMTYLMQQGKNNDEMAENLKILQFSTDNLYALINDVLDFNKIEAGKIELENIEFNIKDLATSIVKSVQQNLSSKNVNIYLYFDNNIPEFLIGDPLRLGQIFNNLVNNAVKFTDNGHISIELSLINKTKEKASFQVSIKDTGIGIAIENQSLIFETFKQADNQTSRIYGGTGLGLGITKKLLELYNSNIQVESVLDKGSNFFFTIKLNIASQVNTQFRTEEYLDDQALKGTKVLLVEDFPMNVKIATRFLEKWGMVYDTAANGRIAVEKLKQNNYQIVLMDLLMPEMDGYIATQNIRKFDKTTPIIALTASALNSQDRVYEVGMNGFLTKPFNPKELFQKINKHSLRA